MSLRAFGYGAVVLIAVALLSHCKRSNNPRNAPAAAPAAKAMLRLASLPAAELDRVMKGCVLIASPGKPYQQGVLVPGDAAKPGSFQYLIVCAAIPDKKTIYFSRLVNSVQVIATARKVADLPSGLSIYSFESREAITCLSPGKASPGESVHCVKLTGEGEISEENRLAMVEKVRVLQEQEDLFPQERREMMRGRRPGGMLPGDRDSLGRHLPAVEGLSILKMKLEMPARRTSIREIGNARAIAELELDAPALENTILVSSARTLLAIRHQGKWVDPHETLATPVALDAVTLHITGSRDSVNLSCQLSEKQTFRQPAYSMVAATTYELEGLTGGSLEERLAKVKPAKFPVSGADRSLRKSLNWNGRPTALWIRMFRDDHPEKLILDEMILLDYVDGFYARWGKPPSPLIRIPPSEPDLPADLVRSRTTLETGGVIRDMVAAGDGSVLVIQTDKPPYWTPLDLKTGLLAAPPWKATADTLLAAQAGNVYLIDRKSGVVEIWDLASGKRTGWQLLPVGEEISSVAAPLTAPNQPVLIVTRSNAVFMDPLTFEILPNGFDIRSCFSGPLDERHLNPRFVPDSFRARASGDGALYSIVGTSDVRRETTMMSITVDQNGIANARNSSAHVIAARGRYQNENFPDHGGGNLHVVARGGSDRFPEPSGIITIRENKGNKPFAELNGAPLVPRAPTIFGAPLMRDRRLYLDSSLGVMVLPDAGKLHVLRLNLPPVPPAPLEFVFTGEDVFIPLPPGTDHRLVSQWGGKVTIENSILKWSVPASLGGGTTIHDNLEWTGELGTSMNKGLEFPMVQQLPRPTIETPDGKESVSLKLRGVIPPTARVIGLAGCGEVLLTREATTWNAWSLATCELLFSTPAEEHAGSFCGDADHLYLLNSKGVLTSYDIATGNLLKEAVIGHGESTATVERIIAGHSSRLPLLAVEKNGSKYSLLGIDRTSLAARTIPIPEEGAERFSNPGFNINASGSVAVSISHVVFQNPQETSVKYIPQAELDGMPDATGRYIYSYRQILDIGVSPPVSTLISTLPGVRDSSRSFLDQFGRYLLVRDFDGTSADLTFSVRAVRRPGEELCKLRVWSGHGSHAGWVISGSRTLVQTSSAAIRVHDFVIPAVAEGLSEPPGDPSAPVIPPEETAAKRTLTSKPSFKEGSTARLVDSPPGVLYNKQNNTVEWTPPPFSKSLETRVLFLVTHPDGSDEVVVHAVSGT